MSKFERAYAKVEELRKQFPRMRTSELMAMAKVSGSNYYRGRRQTLDARVPLAKGGSAQ